MFFLSIILLTISCDVAKWLNTHKQVQWSKSKQEEYSLEFITVIEEIAQNGEKYTRDEQQNVQTLDQLSFDRRYPTGGITVNDNTRTLNSENSVLCTYVCPIKRKIEL